MLTTTEMQSFEKKVRALMGRASDDVRQLEVESGRLDLRAGNPGPAVAASLTGEANAAGAEDVVGFVLLEHEQNLLDECIAALDRIDAGTYGECEDCHGRITKARLKVIPYARNCLECARQRERGPG